MNPCLPFVSVLGYTVSISTSFYITFLVTPVCLGVCLLFLDLAMSKMQN